MDSGWLAAVALPVPLSARVAVMCKYLLEAGEPKARPESHKFLSGLLQKVCRNVRIVKICKRNIVIIRLIIS